MIINFAITRSTLASINAYVLLLTINIFFKYPFIDMYVCQNSQYAMEFGKGGKLFFTSTERVIDERAQIAYFFQFKLKKYKCVNKRTFWQL